MRQLPVTLPQRFSTIFQNCDLALPLKKVSKFIIFREIFYTLTTVCFFYILECDLYNVSVHTSFIFRSSVNFFLNGVTIEIADRYGVRVKSGGFFLFFYFSLTVVGSFREQKVVAWID